MPLKLKTFTADELRNDPKLRKFAFPKKVASKFPQVPRLNNKALLVGQIRDWQKNQRMDPGAAPQNPEIKYKLDYVSPGDLGVLHKMKKGDAGYHFAVQSAMGPEKLASVVATSMTLLAFSNLEAEYLKKQKAANTPALKSKLQKEWGEINKAYSEFISTGSARKVDSRRLKSQSATLKRSKYFEVIRELDASSTLVRADDDFRTLAAGLVATFPVVVGDADIETDNTNATSGNLCDHPIQNTWTQTFSRSFEFRVTLRVWCPTWTNPFRTCLKTFVLAGVSFSMGANLGYRIDCRGFSAWGSAYAQACATVIAITICSGCSGLVQGAAAIGQATGAGDCIYGAGLRFVVTCKFAGITVFYFGWNLGLVIHAPCI